MKRLILFIAISLVTIGGLIALSQNQSALSTTDIETLNLANRLYNNGDYQEAIQLYQQLIDNDIHNATVYFNLANAYYEKGEITQSIDQYRLAQALAPRDEAINHNLELALAQAETSSDTPNQFMRVVQIIDEQSTDNELALLTFSIVCLGTVFWQARHAVQENSRKRLPATV